MLEAVETKDEVVVVRTAAAGDAAGAGAGGRGLSSLPIPCHGPRRSVSPPLPPFCGGYGCGGGGGGGGGGGCCCCWEWDVEAEREELEAEEEEEEERRLLLGLPSCSRWKMLGAPRAAG